MAVRIIGGSLGGRKLAVPASLGLRPTPDRVRETVFNWLQAEIGGSHCLDLFAGSGGLGLEAYSRGAASVVAVEKIAAVFQVLRQRAVDWRLSESYQVQKADAISWLQQNLKTYQSKPFDLIFLDPPFHKDYLPRVLNILRQGYLAADGLLYVEREPEAPLPDYCECVKEKKAGMVVFGLYKLLR